MAVDRVFVPAAFVGRLAQMPRRDAGSGVRVAWLVAQLAELTDGELLGTVHGLAALRLATHIQRELAGLGPNTGRGERR